MCEVRCGLDWCTTPVSPGFLTLTACPSRFLPMEPQPEVPLESADATGASGVEEPTPDSGGVTLDQARLVLRRVKDPELNLNIVDLGLIYEIHVEGADINVDMSLTSPGCPSGPEIMGEAEKQLRTVPGVGDVKINLIWSPPWTPDRIEPRVRTYLGF